MAEIGALILLGGLGLMCVTVSIAIIRYAFFE